MKSITVVNRTISKAVSLAEELSAKMKKKNVEKSLDEVVYNNNETIDTVITGIGFDNIHLPDTINTCAMLVNTTSAGMDESLPLLINPDWLRVETIVYDIVYTPPRTKLLKAANAKGCSTIEGIGMLVHQGAIAFERWTGVKPCVNTMKNALLIK